MDVLEDGIAKSAVDFHLTSHASDSSAFDTRGILVLDQTHSLPEEANAYLDDFIHGSTPSLEEEVVLVEEERSRIHVAIK